MAPNVSCSIVRPARSSAGLTPGTSLRAPNQRKTIPRAMRRAKTPWAAIQPVIRRSSRSKAVGTRPNPGSRLTAESRGAGAHARQYRISRGSRRAGLRRRTKHGQRPDDDGEGRREHQQRMLRVSSTTCGRSAVAEGRATAPGPGRPTAAAMGPGEPSSVRMATASRSGQARASASGSRSALGLGVRAAAAGPPRERAGSTRTARPRSSASGRNARA